MMISIQVESFRETLEEFKKVVPYHYQDLIVNKKQFPLNPNYEAYGHLEDQGMILFITLRIKGELGGYILSFINESIHYRPAIMCSVDIFYVHKPYQGQWHAMKMFRLLEKEARNRKVDLMMASYKVHKSTAALFKRCGWQPFEVYYAKELNYG